MRVHGLGGRGSGQGAFAGAGRHRGRTAKLTRRRRRARLTVVKLHRLAVLLAVPILAHAEPSVTYSVERKTLSEVSADLAAGRVTSEALTTLYLARIDAIDRGDAIAARDALNRGADLNARNVLGQRPLDMSIDLSRNSITFLLLSMRSQVGDPDAGAPVQETDTPPPTTGKEHRVAHRRQARPVEIATAQRRATFDAQAPQPSAGFLGFGSR